MRPKPSFARDGSTQHRSRIVIDSTDAQLYSTTFAPLVEGQEARLLLQPGRGNQLQPGMEIDYRGTRLRYRLRLEAFLPERSGSTKSRKPLRSNRLSVRVVSIGADLPDEPAPCRVCKGSGAIEVPGVCPECRGHAHGCPDCEGTGRLEWSECVACHGRGRAPR